MGPLTQPDGHDSPRLIDAAVPSFAGGIEDTCVHAVDIATCALFDGDAFRQVARLVDVGALDDGGMIGQQLDHIIELRGRDDRYLRRKFRDKSLELLEATTVFILKVTSVNITVQERPRVQTPLA